MYSDLIGPINPKAQGIYWGAKYVLTFIDNYSCYAFIYFLAKKDEVFKNFKRFKTFIEKKLGFKIEILHMDWGGEFICIMMKTFLKEEGIVHEKMALHSPQSNGVAEHFNRMLLEGEWTFLFTSNIYSTL